MDFIIQAGNPRFTGIFDPEDENLHDAIETVFPFYTEYAILKWKSVYIPIDYKYDLSLMVTDIIHMLKKIRTANKGRLDTFWASDTFANHWHLEWMDDTLTVSAQWNSVLGHTEDLLNQMGSITISKQSFLYEWKKVLGNIIDGLKFSGYHEKNLEGMDSFIYEYQQIEQEGILYTV